MIDQLMPVRRELSTATDPPCPRVRVTAKDYTYEGWLVSTFNKVDEIGNTTQEIRCVVQDANRRLFIHSPAQLEALVSE